MRMCAPFRLCFPDCRRWVWGGIVLVSAFPVFAPVRAEDQLSDQRDSGRIIVIEENDKFASSHDRHYTQGLRAAYVSGFVTPDGAWDQPFGWLADNVPIFAGADRHRKYEWTVIGQNIFTPTNTARANPSPKDSPYAAWLYTGVGLLQETTHESYHTLENVELLAGVVGPAALGGVTQNDFHQFVGTTSSEGWKNQLHNEPGLVASYERKWRVQQPLIGGLVVDAIPELGVSVGNILTYGEAGGIVRFGQNLAADYGVDRIRPSLSGTGWFDSSQLDGAPGWYVFFGAQGRAVGRNIFLDGNSFTSSPSVDKKTLVADIVGGASLFWSSAARFDFTITQRTKEFCGRQGRADRFGSLTFSVGL